MVAKRDLNPGVVIEKGIGSFDVRGETVEITKDKEHVPAGLLYNARVKRKILKGQLIHFDDVALPESEAYEIWINQIKKL